MSFRKQTTEEHFSLRSQNYNNSSNWVKDRKLLDRIVELAAPTENSRLLDLASGTGLVGETFLPKTPFIAAIDLSPEMLKSNRLPYRIFALGESLPFKRETFDFCVCRQGLQFMELDKTLPEIFRILKPDGKILLCQLTAYNENDKDTTFKVQHLRNPSRKNYFLPEDFQFLLEKNGFKKIYTEEYISEESLKQWTGNRAIDDITKEEIFIIYRNAPLVFHQLHKTRFTADDIYDSMKFLIILAKK